MPTTRSDIRRLEHIKDRMEELIGEAKDLVRSADRSIYARAKGYWIAHIIMNLSKSHEYMGGSGCTMEETIKELKQLVEDEPDEENFEADGEEEIEDDDEW